jgi:hypothetical protein
MFAKYAKAAGCRLQESNPDHRQDKSIGESRVYPRLRADRSLPGKAEVMTLLAQVKFAGLSIQAVTLLKWLADWAGSPPQIDESGRWVIEVKPHHAPTLAQFAELHPGRSGKTSERSVRRWLAELVEAGIVETIRTRRGNGYLLVVPPAAIAARKTRRAGGAVRPGTTGNRAGYAAGGSEGDRTVGSGSDLTVGSADLTVRSGDLTVGSGDRTVRSSRRSSDKTDKTHHTHPTPTLHTVQEPVLPPGAGGGGGGDDHGIEDPEGLPVREALIAIENATEDRTEGPYAVQKALHTLTDQVPELRAGDYEAIRKAVLRAASRIYGTANPSGTVDRWLAAARVKADPASAALVALRRVGVSEGMIARLTASVPSEAIVATVRSVEADAKVRNRAGAVVTALNGYAAGGRETLTEVAVA